MSENGYRPFVGHSARRGQTRASLLVTSLSTGVWVCPGFVLSAALALADFRQPDGEALSPPASRRHESVLCPRARSQPVCSECSVTLDLGHESTVSYVLMLPVPTGFMTNKRH